MIISGNLEALPSLTIIFDHLSLDLVDLLLQLPTGRYVLREDQVELEHLRPFALELLTEVYGV